MFPNQFLSPFPKSWQFHSTSLSNHKFISNIHYTFLYPTPHPAFICEMFPEKIKWRAKTCLNTCLLSPVSIYSSPFPANHSCKHAPHTSAAALKRCFHSWFTLAYSPYIPGDFCELESACSTHSQKLSLALQLIWSKTTVLTVTLKVVWIPYSHYFIFSTNVAHSTPNTTPAAAAKRSEDYICASLRYEDHRWEWLERKGKNCNSG